MPNSSTFGRYSALLIFKVQMLECYAQPMTAQRTPTFGIAIKLYFSTNSIYYCKKNDL